MSAILVIFRKFHPWWIYLLEIIQFLDNITYYLFLNVTHFIHGFIGSTLEIVNLLASNSSIADNSNNQQALITTRHSKSRIQKQDS